MRPQWPESLVAPAAAGNGDTVAYKRGILVYQNTHEGQRRASQIETSCDTTDISSLGILTFVPQFLESHETHTH